MSTAAIHSPATRSSGARTSVGMLVSHGQRLAKSGVAWGIFVSSVLVLWTVFDMGGLEYYRTPLSVRGYAPAHRLLRPSGPVGQMFGVVGTLLLLVPFAYMARKRIKRVKPVGTLKVWLEIHLFCGVVGPALVTLHTTFKFNGIISTAYWSMVLVMLSGFVGRYLYVRIPRSIRGNELTRAELSERAEELRDELSRSVSPGSVLDRIEVFERTAVPATEEDLSSFDLMFGELALGRRLRAFEQALEADGISPETRSEIVRVTAERSMLLRRAAYLRRIKTLFGYWHVFHLPLVYLLLVIATAHIAVALYLGYVPFRW